MSYEIANDFLQIVNEIVKEYQLEMDKNGSRFNIFSILKVTSKEVRLLTKFITELLNNQGSHGLNNHFFLKFLEQLKNKIYGKLNVNSILELLFLN